MVVRRRRQRGVHRYRTGSHLYLLLMAARAAPKEKRPLHAGVLLSR